MRELYLGLLALSLFFLSSQSVAEPSRSRSLLLEKTTMMDVAAGDEICLRKEKKVIACGKIQTVFSKSVLVKLIYGEDEETASGDEFQVVIKKTDATPFPAEKNFTVLSQTSEAIELNAKSGNTVEAASTQLAFASFVLDKAASQPGLQAADGMKAYWPKKPKKGQSGDLLEVELKPVPTLSRSTLPPLK